MIPASAEQEEQDEKGHERFISSEGYVPAHASHYSLGDEARLLLSSSHRSLCFGAECGKASPTGNENSSYSMLENGMVRL